MLRFLTRDEKFLKLNSVMKLRHLRKRNKIYLKKLLYLRNFLNVLHLYRAFIEWKYRKRHENALEWHRRQAITWKPRAIKIIWNPNCYHYDNNSTVILRFYRCQLTMNYVIRSPRLFSFDINKRDNIYDIFFGREALKKSLLTVGQRESKRFVIEVESICCERLGLFDRKF